MADINNVSNTVIKDLYQRLEGLDCEYPPLVLRHVPKMTDYSPNRDPSAILRR